MGKKGGIKLELVLESARECLQSSIQWKCVRHEGQTFFFFFFLSILLNVINLCNVFPTIYHSRFLMWAPGE